MNRYMLSFTIISNITANPFLELALSKHYLDKKIQCHYISLVDLHDPVNKTKIHAADYIIILIDFCEYTEIHPIFSADTDHYTKYFKMLLELSLDTYDFIKLNCRGHIIWYGYENYDYSFEYALGQSYFCSKLVDDVNLSISNYIYKEDVFIDFKGLIAKIGSNNAYSKKSKYRWNSPYSELLWDEIAKEIRKQHHIYLGVTKKCLVLDCDNVLWGGILSESGIENIVLSRSGFGRVYYDFQKYVLSLYYHGVILAICSKNDIKDIKTVFRNHDEMLLKEEHISCFMSNWGNKPNNIKQISHKLNISLNSIVFVDDSPSEVAAVKALLPEVTTILFKKNINYNEFSCFNLKTNVEIMDIKKRTRTYQTNSLRDELKVNSIDYAEYISTLNVVVDIHIATPIEYHRLSELTQRANKCTNGMRYTVADIKVRAGQQGVTIYSICVSDRFSDLGLVGAMEVENSVLTLFCLSCRSLGREVEKQMITYLLKTHTINNIVFISTTKNEKLKKLLKNYIDESTINK